NTTLSALRASFDLRGSDGGAREFPVEPVVVALVDVLLRVADQTKDPAERESLLIEARARLEDVNAGEIQDYFEDECVAAQRHATPESVPGTLVIYPAPLRDRLELIVSAGNETRVFSTPVSGAELAAEIAHFRRTVQDRTSSDYLASADKLYD